MTQSSITRTVEKAAACLSRRDAAHYLSISTRLLDQYATAGEIARIKLGRKTLFQRSELDRFAESKIVR